MYSAKLQHCRARTLERLAAAAAGGTAPAQNYIDIDNNRHNTMHAHTDILAIASLAALLSAATSCDRARPENTSSCPINFAAAPLTKAPVENVNDISGFEVWGWNGINPVFTRELVYGGAGSWTYDNTKYWMDGTYTFHALYPASAGEESTSSAVSDIACTAEDGLSLTFITPSDAGIDLMTASAVRSYSVTAPDASAVPLDFQHLLSRVSILARVKGGNAVINSFSLTGIEGRVSWKSGMQHWELTAGYTLSFGGNNVHLSAQYVPLLQDLLLIPQDIEGAVLTIDYTVDGNSKKHEAALPSEIIWEAGSSYTYTLTVQGDYITFDTPRVNAWDEAVGGIIIVE